MAGLINVGILKPELATSFATGYRQAEQQRNTLAEQAQQREMNRYKLDQIKQDRAAMQKLQQQLLAAGKDPDMNKVFDALIETGNPDYVMKGIEGKQRLKAITDFDAMYGRDFGVAAPGAAPAPANAMAAPGAAPAMPAAPANAMVAPGAAPAAAPVNAMAAPPTEQFLRQQYVKYSSSADPRAKAIAEMYKTQLAEMHKVPTSIREFQYGQENPAFAQRQLELKRASAPSTKVVLPPQETEFEKGLGGGQSKAILESRTNAEDAAQILATNQVGRDLLNSGAITGTGAEFLVGLNQALKQVGIDFGYAEAADNSQAYAANMGANVGKLIKQFGAGTGLSDADRSYAERMAGGKINLTESALRRIIDINDRAANNVIDLHNKKVKGIKTNVPLTVEKPTPAPRRAGAADIPGQGPAPAAAPAARTVVRTGTLNGRRVVQYSDGSTAYAD